MRRAHLSQLPRPWRAAALCGLAAQLCAAEASAYCRTRTCEFRAIPNCALDSDSLCSTRGAEASWFESCIPFVVQRDGSRSQGLEATRVANLISEGFRTWSTVECQSGLGTPPLTAVFRGLTACDQVEYNCFSEANSNLIVFRDEPSDLDPFTLAQTTLTANLSTGEILDADIEFNSFDHLFEIDARSKGATELRVVVNHELGHFLGLSHSQNPRALMQDRYDGPELPQADDIAGVCAIFGASGRDPSCARVNALSPTNECVGHVTDDSCPTQPTSVLRADSGCLLMLGGRRSPKWPTLAPLSLALLALLWRQRRSGLR